MRYGQTEIRSVNRHRRNEGGQTPVCPTGQEVCGDPVPGHGPPCCPIIKTPTPPTPVPNRRGFPRVRAR